MNETVETATLSKLEFEEIGRKEFGVVHSQFTFQNNIQTLDNCFFDVYAIRNALKHLIAISKSEHPEAFMNLPLRDWMAEPSDWLPTMAEHWRTEEELEARMQDEIEVYFNGVCFEVRQTGKDKKWFEPIHSDFLPYVEGSRAGLKKEYWYGNSPDERSSSKFEPKAKDIFYQAFLYLFNEALGVYSCSVAYPSPGIEIQSHRTIQYGFDDKGSWKGTLEDFLESAARLRSAVYHMIDSGKYKIIKKQGEVRLIHPELGLLSMNWKPFEELRNHPEFYQEAHRKVTTPLTFIIGKKAMGMLREKIQR